MRISGLFLLAFCLLSFHAHAENSGAGAAPELFGVREVIIDYAHFDDPKASDTCGLTREQVADVLARALEGTGVPATPIEESRPPVLGVARISLVPTVSTHVDESLNCVSWVALSAENRANAVIPPVGTLRGVTVIYWRQHIKAASSESTHQQLIGDVLQKMAGQFVQQYKLDQPPEQSQ